MSEEVKAPRPPKRTPKKKVCVFCVEHIDYIDYKDAARLRRFITEKGKILPRRMSGVCAKHQRPLATAIKRATPTIKKPLPFRQGFLFLRRALPLIRRRDISPCRSN